MRGKKRRVWDDAVNKVSSESHCRFCGMDSYRLASHGLRLETVHLCPRIYDPIDEDGIAWVDPNIVVAACGPATSSSSCHSRFDRGHIDALPHLTREEQAAVVLAVGLEDAYVRLTSRVDL